MMWRLFCLAIIAQTIAGCAVLQPASTPVPSPDISTEPKRAALSKEGEEALALLAYYQALAVMTPEELRREYQVVSQSYARDKSEPNRLRLAFVMSLSGLPGRDDAKLVSLLDGATSRSMTPESPRRQWALLLQKQATERLREQRRADDQQRRADEQQRRADELQQKLDAMLNIERRLRRETKKP